MGEVLMFIPLGLVVISGALKWPLWMIAVCGLVVSTGFFALTPHTLRRLSVREGLVLVITPAIAMICAACAALFAVGHLLNYLWSCSSGLP